MDERETYFFYKLNSIKQEQETIVRNSNVQTSFIYIGILYFQIVLFQKLSRSLQVASGGRTSICRRKASGDTTTPVRVCCNVSLHCGQQYFASGAVQTSTAEIVSDDKEGCNRGRVRVRVKVRVKNHTHTMNELICRRAGIDEEGKGVNSCAGERWAEMKMQVADRRGRRKAGTTHRRHTTTLEQRVR